MPAAAHGQRTLMPRWLAILLVSLAGLLLEVAYTRIVSYKLWYYYTYLVIGLALLGIGSGGVFVAVSARLRRWSTDRIVAVCSIAGAVTVAIGYLVVARTPVDSIAIWNYGTRASVVNVAALGAVCLALYATFIAIGVIVSVLLGRAGDGVGRLYFADLVGAGAACLVAIPLIVGLGPPAVIAVAAAVLLLVGVLSAPPLRSRVAVAAGGGIAAVVAAVALSGALELPEVRVESTKIDGSGALYSGWGPVFRVDVLAVGSEDSYLLSHDGTFGSGIRRFDGDAAALTSYDNEPRAIPFHVLGEPPARELIIGSAGGNEILASLAFGAPRIEAVELNPVTVGILDDEFADYTGHLPARPEVDLHQGDGRSYLARGDERYDLIWFVAPDSYAATNAASSGAFVLSESYLYTTEMIEETLAHLTDDGIMVVQFGELDVSRSSNRTARYIVTARAALADHGIDDPSRHLLVSGFLTEAGDLSTIIVKRTPFAEDEVTGFAEALRLQGPQAVMFHAPGAHLGDLGEQGAGVLTRLASGTADEVEAIVASHAKDISTVTDDAPFFWHFSPFGDVLGDILEPITVTDPEDAVGERVLLLLLAFAAVYAAVFLLLPFLVVRRRWSALPAKGASALYFAALGLGFMLFEITMIQRLSAFLGYPTYSLTVTLASILVSTGIGALLSRRFAGRERSVMPGLLAVLAVLTVFYQFGLPAVTSALLDQGLPVRVAAATAALVPLGLVLGVFMPLGLGQVHRLTATGEAYVAWAWAVNGFFSVIGSVLTTILSMTFGFRAVQFGALAVYGMAAVAFTKLRSAAADVTPVPSEATVPVLEPVGVTPG